MLGEVASYIMVFPSSRPRKQKMAVVVEVTRGEIYLILASSKLEKTVFDVLGSLN